MSSYIKFLFFILSFLFSSKILFPAFSPISHEALAVICNECEETDTIKMLPCDHYGLCRECFNSEYELSACSECEHYYTRGDVSRHEEAFVTATRLSLPPLAQVAVVYPLAHVLEGPQTDVRIQIFSEPKIVRQSRNFSILEGFYKLIIAGDLKWVKLHSRHLSLEEGDVNGNTAFHIAAQSNQLAIMRFFLKKGGDVSLLNKNQRRAIEEAEAKGFSEMVSLLKGHLIKSKKNRRLLLRELREESRE